MLSATELHRRGVAHSASGRFSAARVSLTRALQRTDDLDLRTRIEVSLAYVESETGDLAGGLARCTRADRRRPISAETRAIVRSQLATLYMRAGEDEAALKAFSQAADLLRSQPAALGRVLTNRAQVFLRRGDLDRAREDFARAGAEFEKAGLSEEVARAQHNLGYTELLAGDLLRALRLMERAAAVLAPLSPVSRAIGEQDRAEVLIAAGMSHEGRSLLADASRAFGARRLQQLQAECELVLARTLTLDDPRQAARIARRASRRFADQGSSTWALRADAVALRSEIEGGGRHLDLVDRCRTLSQRLRRSRLRHEALALDLESVRVPVANDPDTARALISKVRLGPQTPIGTRLLAREVRSELAMSEGHRGQALAQVRRGLSDLHAWQSSFGSLDLQSSLVGHGRRLALQGMRLALADGRPDLVFEWSERARALVSRVSPVRPPSDAHAATDLAELRYLQAQARETELSTALARREAELRGRIRQRAWYDEGSREVVEPSSVEEVRARLVADDAALAAYLVVDDRVHALVLAPHDVVVRDLGPYAPVRVLLDGMLADLDMSAASLPAAMRAAVRAGLQERLDALATYLVEPIADTIGDHSLVITPSGALAGTPWTMLPGLVGRPVTIPRSASIWLQRRQVPLRLDSAGFVAGPRVPRAEEEVHKAASAWSRSRIVAGHDATAAAVSDLAHEVDVLHVSAHGRHSADNPLFSGLELTGGPWFGYDIDQLDRIPQAVILSACELGRSTVRWGEESIGMTAAWLHAGTHCVIASPASVADDVACEVLGETHQLMAGGVAPAEALARASVRTLDPLPASFQCFGTGW